MKAAQTLSLIAKLVGAVIAVAVAARLSMPIPGAAVPQSAQTLAVIVVGGLLGPGLGAAAMVLYIGLGAAGLPVFADGASGVSAAVGPSAGYLLGFVVAAWGIGKRMRSPAIHRNAGRMVQLWQLCLGGIALHLVILSLGGLRLAAITGLPVAISSGVLPFLWGGVVKSGVAAVMLSAWLRRSNRPTLPRG